MFYNGQVIKPIYLLQFVNLPIFLHLHSPKHSPSEEMPSLAEDGKTPLPPAAQTAPGQPREGSTHSHENAGEADHVIMMPEDEPVKKGDKKKKDAKGGDEEKVKKKVWKICIFFACNVSIIVS